MTSVIRCQQAKCGIPSRDCDRNLL